MKMIKLNDIFEEKGHVLLENEKKNLYLAGPERPVKGMILGGVARLSRSRGNISGQGNMGKE